MGVDGREISNQEMVLRVVAAAGLITVALVAPNALGAMTKLGILPAARKKEYIETAQRRMIRRGLLKREGQYVRLTPAGEAQLRRLEILNHRLKKPKKWDKKWRVLIFDIPERRQKTRRAIRLTLLRLGFVRLQDSVWVYPYNCENLVSLLKADFKVGKDLQYLVVEKIEYDRSLKEHFSLT